MSFVGIVCEPIDEERGRRFGAAFAWRDGRFFVTADHVVTAALERGVERLYVEGPSVWPNVILSIPVTVAARDSLRDVALLVAEEGSEIVGPFREAAAPVVGEVVGSLCFVGDGMDELVTRVTGVGRVYGTSTAATRGSESGDAVPFAFDALVLADNVDDGFCGAPLVNVHGQVVGVVSKRRDGRGIATRFDLTVPWLSENTDNTKVER
jgi:S1-C subfamily serine protease